MIYSYIACLCDIFYYICSRIFYFIIYVWECFQLRYYRVKTWESCFEKSEVLNGFINDASKLRNRNFCTRKSGERGDTWCFLSRGDLWMKGRVLGIFIGVSWGELTPWRTPWWTPWSLTPDSRLCHIITLL